MNQSDFFGILKKKKIKEIIQVRFGEKQGKYYAFFENGDVAANGQFSFDKPVGTWTEFYKSGKKKREIKHTESAFNLNESFITREWNINGKLIYESCLSVSVVYSIT